MKIQIFVSIALLALGVSSLGMAQTKPAPAAAKHPVVAIETTMGTIKVELLTDKAPVTTKNFLDYVNAGFYNGLIIHRVDFAICGGGYTENLQPRPTRPGILNESKNGLKNVRGTLAMARYDDPNSATSQFFISPKDNPHLDPSGGGFGYAVFAKVVEGMDVVDKIAAVKTANKGAWVNVPVQTITIKSAKVAE
jgi:peptidyl-prolyl cis-trans isomerase A (cyclophilin A)